MNTPTIPPLQDAPRLTQDQKDAIKFLNSFYALHKEKDEPREAVLCGYAGTGKTWLVGNWLTDLLFDHPSLDVCIAAPTHKALDVLRSKCGHLPVAFMTLNALLGVSIRKNDEGDVLSERYDAENKFGLVVVDEASMVNAEFRGLLGVQVGAGRLGCVVYVGDPAQLPPVKEDISLVFKIDNMITLEEIVRYDGAIIKVATYLREKITSEEPFNLFEINELCSDPVDRSVSFIPRDGIYKWAERAFHKQLDARIVSWTNAAVAKHNKVLHDVLYPGTPFFGVGERVLCNDSYTIRKPEEGKRATSDDGLYNGEILTVVSCTPSTPIRGVVVYEVEATKASGTVINVLVTPNETLRLAEHTRLNEEIYGLRNYRSNLAEATRRTELVAIRKAIGRLCPLQHSYASTVHKAQGSTYQICIVDFSDLYRSEDKARLMYVATTRPSQFLAYAR